MFMNDNLVATATVHVDADPDDVWRAITEPEFVVEYFFGTTVESAWVAGSAITWSGEYEGTAYRDHGTVLEAVPGELLIHTHFSPLTGAQDVPENYHTLTWRLLPDPDGTTLTLTQDNNHSYDEVEHSERNWQNVLDGLKAVVESAATT